MDRQIVREGAIPFAEDLAYTNRFAMVGIGKLAAAQLGITTQVAGLPCTPTSPTSMNVKVDVGEIYAYLPIDATAFGVLDPDTSHMILKQGLLMDAVTLSCPAPGTVGFSINYLIEAAYADQDNSPTVLPYYNASNPAVAYSGPANSGVAEPTIRHSACVITVKAGTAAATGTQTTPSTDAGNVPLYIVTVAHGATIIVSGNISLHPSAPFLSAPGTVPATTSVAGVAALATRAEGAAGTNATKIVTPDVMAQATIANETAFCVASGSANTITGSVIPNPAAMVAGIKVDVLVTATNTGAATFNLNALGAIAITANGAALAAGQMLNGTVVRLVYDGTNWQLSNATITPLANNWTGLQSFTGTVTNLAALLTNAKEICTVAATAATGTIPFYVSTQSVLYFTSNASANWTINLTLASGHTLDSAMAVGEVVTVTHMVTQGGTAKYNNVVQVDGTTTGVTTKWQGGAPSSGNASGIDVYTYAIIKTGAATFTVLASQTPFA